MRNAKKGLTIDRPKPIGVLSLTAVAFVSGLLLGSNLVRVQHYLSERSIESGELKEQFGAAKGQKHPPGPQVHTNATTGSWTLGIDSTKVVTLHPRLPSEERRIDRQIDIEEGSLFAPVWEPDSMEGRVLDETNSKVTCIACHLKHSVEPEARPMTRNKDDRPSG